MVPRRLFFAFFYKTAFVNQVYLGLQLQNQCILVQQATQHAAIMSVLLNDLALLDRTF